MLVVKLLSVIIIIIIIIIISIMYKVSQKNYSTVGQTPWHALVICSRDSPSDNSTHKMSQKNYKLKASGREMISSCLLHWNMASLPLSNNSSSYHFSLYRVEDTLDHHSGASLLCRQRMSCFFPSHTDSLQILIMVSILSRLRRLKHSDGSEGGFRENWRPRSMMHAQAARYQMVPVRFQCRSSAENQ